MTAHAARRAAGGPGGGSTAKRPPGEDLIPLSISLRRGTIASKAPPLGKGTRTASEKKARRQATRLYGGMARNPANWAPPQAAPSHPTRGPGTGGRGKDTVHNRTLAPVRGGDDIVADDDDGTIVIDADRCLPTRMHHDNKVTTVSSIANIVVCRHVVLVAAETVGDPTPSRRARRSGSTAFGGGIGGWSCGRRE